MKFYDKPRNWLATHQKAAFFLSHGLLHIIVLIVLIILGILLSISVARSSSITTRCMEIEVGDSTNNYALTYLNIYLRLGYQDESSQRPKASLDVLANFDNLYIDRKEQFVNNYRCIPYITIRQPKNYNTRTATVSDENQTLDPSDKPTKPISTWIFFDKSNNTWNFYEYVASDSIQTPLGWFVGFPGNINFNGNAFFEENNPHYRLFLKIHTNQDLYTRSIDSTSRISIRFPKSLDIENPEITTFNYIYPEPTHIGLNTITYIGKDVKQVLDDGGIYIEGENRELAIKADRLSMLFSVLIGTIIAFALDIIIQLIYKWRRLQRRETVNTIRHNYANENSGNESSDENKIGNDIDQKSHIPL